MSILRNRRLAFRSMGGGSLTSELAETFEASEYDLAWTESGAPDGDSTTQVKVGTKSLYLAAADDRIEIAITDRDDYTFEAWFYLGATPGATATAMGFRTSAGGARVLMRVNTSRQLAVYDAGDSAFTTDALTLNTWYKVRMVWKDLGTCSMEFSTDGTFLGSGNKYTSKTGSTYTDIVRLRIGHTAGVTLSYWDDITLGYPA